MSDVFRVGTTPVSIAASPNSHATVTNGGAGTVYYKNSSDVTQGSNDGSIASGSSVTFTSGVHWLVSSATGARVFVSYSPDAQTDMATQAELSAASTGLAYGTLADRPSAGAVADGYSYNAIDDNGGTLSQVQGAGFVDIAVPTSELQYVERTTNDTGFTDTSYTDLSGITITFTAGAKPIWLEFYTPVAVIGTSGAALFVQICDNTASTTYIETSPTAAAASQNAPLTLRRRLSGVFTEGNSYTVKVQRKVSSGAATLKGAAPAGPMYLVAREA